MNDYVVCLRDSRGKWGAETYAKTLEDARREADRRSRETGVQARVHTWNENGITFPYYSLAHVAAAQLGRGSPCPFSCGESY